MKLFKYLALLFIIFCLGSASFSWATDLIADYNGRYGQSCSLQKANTLEDLLPFASIERIDVYKEILSGTHQSPFGVYVLKEEPSGQAVGLQSLAPLTWDEILAAEEMTDILPEHQGKGYGTILRTKTAETARKFIEEKSLHNNLPLSFLYSDNEWFWGFNHASLKSSLAAGYGIVCITEGMGAAHMVFPKNEYCWNENRLKHLLTASKLLQASFANTSPQGNNRKQACENLSKEHKETVTESFMAILKDCNLEKDPDICSFLAICSFLVSDLKTEETLISFLKSLEKDKFNRLKLFINDNKETEKVSPAYLTKFCGFNQIRFLKYNNSKLFEILIDLDNKKSDSN